MRSLRGGVHEKARFWFGGSTAQICCLCAAVCAAFAAAGAWTLLLYLPATGFAAPSGYFLKLTLKAVFLSAAVAACGWALYTSRHATARADSPTEPSPEPRAASGTWLPWVIATAVIVGAFILPNLAAYPWTAPDELHHLIVARNLAEHGAYASGHSSGTLRYFDHYDSVGPAVILPVAAAFHLFGPEYPAARLVVAMHFAVLCGLAFVFVRTRFGSAAAALSVILLTGALGSVYLARSLYGEVPALMYFLAALMVWQWGLGGRGGAGTLLLAGILFGLALLAKLFIIISLFALAGAWLHDRLHAQHIRPAHVLWPAGGAMVILAVWQAVQWPYRHVTGDDAAAVLYYRHYLTFGLDALPRAVPWFAVQPLVAAGLVLTFVFASRALMRLDPPWMILALTAALFLFWWVFFTPATIPRYTWYTLAIAALFAGPMIVSWRPNPSAPRWRWVSWTALVLIMAAPAINHFSEQTQLVYRTDEMAGERALADALKTLPQDAVIATTFWPAERSANFLADRVISILEGDQSMPHAFAYLIVNRDIAPIPPGSTIVHAAERYALVVPGPHLVLANKETAIP